MIRIGLLQLTARLKERTVCGDSRSGQHGKGKTMTLFLLILLAFLGGLALGVAILLWLSDSLDPLNGQGKSYHPSP